MKRAIVALIISIVALPLAGSAQHVMFGVALPLAVGDVRFKHDVPISSPGVGPEFGILLPVGRTVNFTAETGLLYFGENGLDSRARLVPALLGLRIGFGAGGFLPYMAIGGGVVLVDFHWRSRLTETSTQGTLKIGFGFTLPVTASMFWDLGGDYNFIWSGPGRNELLSFHLRLGIGL